MWLERATERPEVWAILNRIDRDDPPQRKLDRAAALRMTLDFMTAGIRRLPPALFPPESPHLPPRPHIP